MHTETILLVLESVLLVFTIALIAYSIKEGTERKSLLEEVGKATKILTRQEYFLTVTDSMLEAKKDVIGCVTGRLPVGDDTKRTRSVEGNIEKLVSHGIKVRYLMPKLHDRLHMGLKYKRAGAEIRYTNCLIMHDLRFTVVDDDVVIIGLPESTGEKESTRKGYRIPAEGWASLVRTWFHACWDEALDFELYVKEVYSHAGNSVKVLARELRLEEKDLLPYLPKDEPPKES